MKTMNLNINGVPIEKRLQRLKNCLDTVKEINKREKLVHNIQRLELKQKIQILKASEDGPRTPEKQLEILATRLDLVKIASQEKEEMIKNRMKIIQDKIIARQEKKKNWSNKKEQNIATVDRKNNNKGKLSITDRLANQKKFLEEESNPTRCQMITNRITRIKRKIQKKEQRSKRAELQQKISLFKRSSGAEKLSDEHHLEILMDRLKLVTGNLELARNCPSQRQKIEKRLEMLRAKVASIADANASERKERIEKESANKEEKKTDTKANKN